LGARDQSQFLVQLAPVEVGVEPAKLANLPLSFFLGDSVALLDRALELLTIALDDGKVVVGQLAPLFLDFTLEDFPVASGLVFVHFNLLAF
jgi:hypothetical protein